MDPLAKSCMKTYSELTEEKKPVLPAPVPSNMEDGEEGEEGNFEFSAKYFWVLPPKLNPSISF